MIDLIINGLRHFFHLFYRSNKVGNNSYDSTKDRALLTDKLLDNQVLNTNDQGKLRHKVTHDNHVVNINDLMNSSFMNLLNVYRFSNTKLVEHESTAYHTVQMQLIALYLYNKYPTFNIKDVIYRILMHDLDESVLCDIPRDVKYYNTTIYNEINSIANTKLVESGILGSIIHDINNAKENKVCNPNHGKINDSGCYEGSLVGIIDILQCAIKLATELKLQLTSVIYNRFVTSVKTYKYFINNFSELGCNDKFSHSMKYDIKQLHRCLYILYEDLNDIVKEYKYLGSES